MLDQLAQSRDIATCQQAQQAGAASRRCADVRRSIDSCSLAKTADPAGAGAVASPPFFDPRDEPTAPLDAHDSERSFAVVRRLK